MEILELIQAKLSKINIEYDNTETVIALAEVDQCIKNYCHIDEIPQELLFVRVNMVIDYICYINAKAPQEEGSSDVNAKNLGPITSISSGGVSYGFADTSQSKSNAVNAHIADLDSLLTNYIHQLNEFRSVVW